MMHWEFVLSVMIRIEWLLIVYAELTILKTLKETALNALMVVVNQIRIVSFVVHALIQACL